MFVIQTDKQLVEKQNNSLKEQIQRGEIESYQKMSNNRFLVVGASTQPDAFDYFSNVYRNDENWIVIIFPRIVVMLKQEGPVHLILNKYKDKLVIVNGDKQKYILKCNVALSEEVLQLVKEIDLRDDVDWCEPEFLSNYRIYNTLYPQQYYLNNTGQNGGTAGIDINVEPAWNITNGNSNITVAVIDVGVDRNHEDMGNRVLEGFTIRNAIGIGEPQNANILDTKSHGMACSGIIAASNNTIGIRGVASNVNILPVNIVPDEAQLVIGNIVQGFGTNIEIAEAINWAWRRADVLSCSWGGGDPSNYITAAIDSAITFGRNGNGSVVVFASGNHHPQASNVAYPGRVDGVITVGAINNQGAIWNYSQRGTSMDLVAPSGGLGPNGDVRTTDRMGNLGENGGNYMDDFGGTSAACPQVAGTAALILSVNPSLTQIEVRTILQQTATDMGPIGFDNTYGYGRIDAHAAVLTVLPPISGPSLICSSGASFSINTPSPTIIWEKSSNLTRVSPQGANPCIFSTNGSGEGWIEATISNGYSNVTLLRKDVWAGKPTNYHINFGVVLSDRPNDQVCKDQLVSIGVVTNSDAFTQKVTGYNWQFLSWSPYVQGYEDFLGYDNGLAKIQLDNYASAMQIVQVSAINACGSDWEGGLGKAFYAVNCGGGWYMSIYPNPANDYVTLSFVPADESISEDGKTIISNESFRTNELNEYTVEIWSERMGLVKRMQSKEKYLQIRVNDLVKGKYYLHLIYNGEIYKQQLIVE